MADMVLIVTYFSFLLGFGVLVANIMKKVRVPDTFILLLVGLICGPTIWKNPAVAQYISLTIVDVEAMSVVPDFLRTLALVLIVFTGAFNLRFEELKRFSDVSVNLALFLVILNTLVLGAASKLIFGLNWLPSLLIGAILSGTDASVVFTFEEQLKKFGNVLTVLKVESILNSPLSVLIPLILLDLLNVSPGEILSINFYVSQFFLMIVAGMGSGLVIGLVLSKIVSSMVKEYSSLLIISIALLIFGLAESVGGSGMLAVAVAGFIIGNLGFPHKESVKEFQSEFSDMLRISVFTLLGAQIFLDLNPLLLVVEFLFALLVFVVRPIFVTYIARSMSQKEGFEGFALLKFTAPRGISAVAVAPIVAVSLGNDMIMNIVFMVVFFTVLLSTITANMVSTGRAAALKNRTDWLKSKFGRGTPERKEETVTEAPNEGDEETSENKKFDSGKAEE
jgi:cell volume regulation protein A